MLKKVIAGVVAVLLSIGVFKAYATPVKIPYCPLQFVGKINGLYYYTVTTLAECTPEGFVGDVRQHTTDCPTCSDPIYGTFSTELRPSR